MITQQEIRDKNISPAMVSKEAPALDLTRAFIGFNPRSNFKKHYMKSVKLTNEELRARIADLADKKSPNDIIPYMYDAYRRGIPVPRAAAAKYNTPDDEYLRDINLLSAVPAEKYVNVGMAGAGALTGVAAIDYLLEKASPKYKTVEEATKAGLKGDALLRHNISGDAISAGKFKTEMFKQRVMGLKGKDVYNKVFETNLSNVVGGGSPAKAKLVERLVGVAHNLPLTGIAAIPLLSRRVTGKLKGDDKDSARNKVFTWVENHPEATMGAAFAPSVGRTLAGGAFDTAHVIKRAPENIRAGMVGNSVVRTGLNLGKIGLTMSIPLMYMKMRRNMADAKDEENKLIQSKIIKTTRGTNESIPS